MAIFLLLLFVDTTKAGERTIKTRDGRIFQKAEIASVSTSSVKIKHDSGITIVLKENLPKEIQQEIGYKTLGERDVEKEHLDQEKQIEDMIESQTRDEALKAAKEKKLKVAFYAIKSATQADANAYFGLSKDALLEKFGEPVRVERTGNLGHGFTTLFYDERKATRTLFEIADGESTVFRGLFKGVPIRRR